MSDHRMYEELETEELSDPTHLRLKNSVPEDHFPRVWRTVDGEGEWLEAELDEDSRRDVHVNEPLDVAEYVRAVAVPNE